MAISDRVMKAAHPSLRKTLRRPGVEILCFAENAVRSWYRVTTPDGRKSVVVVPR